MPTAPSPGFTLVPPAATTPVAAETVTAPPQVSTWLPELVGKLLSATADRVRTRIAQFAPHALQSQRLPGHFSRDILRSHDGIHAQGGLYADTLAAYALRTPAESASPMLDDWRTQLTAIGKRGGRDWSARGWRRDLRDGPVAVHEQGPTKRLRIELTEAWADVRRETAVRSIDACAILAAAFDVQVVVPSAHVYDQLWTRHGQWLAAHPECIDRRESTQAPAHESAASPVATARAWARTATDDSGPVRLLTAIATAPDQTCSIETLATDETVACARNSVYPYVRQLADAGLLTYTSRAGSQPSTATLTAAGAHAMQFVHTESFQVRDPAQTQLSSQCIHTHNAGGSTVGRPAPAGRDGASAGPDPVDVEEWLATMPESDRWSQWLTGPTADFDADAVHRRTTAPLATGADVALAPDDTTDWAQTDGADARRGYVSTAVDGEFLVMVQYALDPLLTLARLAATVTAPHVLARCLTETTVGREFDAIFETATLALDALATSGRTQLVGGLQVGWLDPDDDCATFRERLRAVRQELIQEAARLGGRPAAQGESAERARCFQRLHGLLATATSTLYAAGLDPIVNLCVPQTDVLAGDRAYRQAFLDFCRYTIPKQAVFGTETGWHSWLRQVADPEAFGWDTDKLRSRLPPGLDDAPDTEATLTTRWVLSGPGIDQFEDRLARALRREQRRLRTTDDGLVPPPLAIEVATTDGPGARQAITERLTATAGAATACQHAIERVATTGDRCSPYTVADLGLCTTGDGPLTRPQLQQAVGRLPPDRLLPTETPAASRLFALLCRSQSPCGRQDACARLEIHPNTYDRQLRRLRERGLLEAHQVNGYRRYTAAPVVSERSTTPDTTAGEPITVNRGVTPSPSTLDGPTLRTVQLGRPPPTTVQQAVTDVQTAGRG